MEGADYAEVTAERYPKVSTGMHLNIDYSKCEGCGGCAEAFPQFFEIRDELAWVINDDKFTLEENKGVLTICPYYAISVEGSQQKKGPAAPW